MPTAGKDCALQRPEGTFGLDKLASPSGLPGGGGDLVSGMSHVPKCTWEDLVSILAGGQEPDLWLRAKAVRPVLRWRISKLRCNEEVETPWRGAACSWLFVLCLGFLCHDDSVKRDCSMEQTSCRCLLDLNLKSWSSLRLAHSLLLQSRSSIACTGRWDPGREDVWSCAV